MSDQPVEEKSTGDGADLQGLVSSTGSAAYVRGMESCSWKFGLPDSMRFFGVLPGESPAASPDGVHWACVAVGPESRHVAIASMRSPRVFVFRRPFTEIHGLAWSPCGSMLLVVARDPSVGAIVLRGASGAAPACSLFLVIPATREIIPLVGSVVLPGMPHWLPSGDAVALLITWRGRTAVAVITLDGRVASIAVDDCALLGEHAWTPDGRLLCALRQGEEMIPCLVDLRRGNLARLSESWHGMTALTAADDESVIVAGKWRDAWCITRISGDTASTIGPLVPSSQTAVAAGRLWFVAPTEKGAAGLWTSYLCEDGAQLKLTAASIQFLRVRPNGRAAAVMAGKPGNEKVHIVAAEGPSIEQVGRRDAIWGWPEQQVPRPPSWWRSLRRAPSS